jgi:MFS family permease
MEFIGSLTFGKLADCCGKRIVYYLMLVVHSIAIAMTFVMNYAQPYLFYVTSAMAGLADSALNTEIYALLGTLYKHSASEAFGCNEISIIANQ